MVDKPAAAAAGAEVGSAAGTDASTATQIAGLQAANAANFAQQIAMTEIANKQTTQATIASEFGKVGDAMASVSAK